MRCRLCSTRAICWRFSCRCTGLRQGLGASETRRRSSLRSCSAWFISSNTHRRFSWPASYTFPELNWKTCIKTINNPTGNISSCHKDLSTWQLGELNYRLKNLTLTLTWCGSCSTRSSRLRGILRTRSIPSRTYWSTSPFKTLSTARCSSLVLDSIPSMADHKKRTFRQPSTYVRNKHFFTGIKNKAFPPGLEKSILSEWCSEELRFIWKLVISCRSHNFRPSGETFCKFPIDRPILRSIKCFLNCNLTALFSVNCVNADRTGELWETDIEVKPRGGQMLWIT